MRKRSASARVVRVALGIPGARWVSSVGASGCVGGRHAEEAPRLPLSFVTTLAVSVLFFFFDATIACYSWIRAGNGHKA